MSDLSDEITPSDDSSADHDVVDHDAVAPTNGSTARTIAAVVGIVLVGLVALFAFGSDISGDEPANRLVGGRVPEMRSTAVDGREYNIDSHRGEWVLVNFFATWCPPCVAEHPDLVKLEGWGEANGRLSLVSVAFNDKSETVQTFFDEFGGTWPVLDDANLSIAFQISQIPESFLIAPSGLVVQHFTGGIRADDMIAIIEANDLPVDQGGVGTGGTDPDGGAGGGGG